MSVRNAKGSVPTPTTHGVSFGGWTLFGTGIKAPAKDLKPKDYYLSYSLTLPRSPCRSASRRATVGTENLIEFRTNPVSTRIYRRRLLDFRYNSA